MEIQFRKLLPSESNSYRELRLDCLKHYPAYFSSNYQNERSKEKLFFQKHIEQASSNNFVIGGFYDNNLVGISGFKRHENKTTNHGGVIIQVYVSQKYQGKNIGSRITRSTLNEAFKINGIEQIEIGVVSNNVKAEKIYTNLGFEVYGIQKKYLKIDAIYYDHKMMIIFKDQFIPEH